MIALLLGFLGLGAGIGAGCGLRGCWGGGGGGSIVCGGGGAMGEEERVIVSLSVAGIAAGWFRVRVCGLAVGGGVVGFCCCAGRTRRMEPPSVSEGRELGSGSGDGIAVGEVVSAGGVGSEC